MINILWKKKKAQVVLEWVAKEAVKSFMVLWRRDSVLDDHAPSCGRKSGKQYNGLYYYSIFL